VLRATSQPAKTKRLEQVTTGDQRPFIMPTGGIFSGVDRRIPEIYHFQRGMRPAQIPADATIVATAVLWLSRSIEVSWPTELRSRPTKIWRRSKNPGARQTLRINPIHMGYKPDLITTRPNRSSNTAKVNSTAEPG